MARSDSAETASEQSPTTHAMLIVWGHFARVIGLPDRLADVPIAQKTAFLLHHEDGISLDELARALDIGFETAKSRLRYSLAKLRTCMGAYLDAAALLPRHATPAPVVARDRERSP